MKVYYPTHYIDIPASAPHEDAVYRVSIGVEHWGDGPTSVPQTVEKIQMVYGGVVSGRRSPSYPAGSDDLQRVYEAMLKLRSGRSSLTRSGRGLIYPGGGGQ